MSPPPGAALQTARTRVLRRVPLIGALFIAAIVALAAFDIWRGYGNAVDDTGRELDSQARIIAEQTARSMQATDVVLRHVAQQYLRGALAGPGTTELDAWLREQVLGLVQIDGLGILDAQGDLRGASIETPVPGAPTNFADAPFFKALRDNAHSGLYIGSAVRSRVDQRWVFPIARRLESRTGGMFAGVIGARGRIDYFQQFYRDVRLEPGTTITLIHGDGTLLARHPPADDALGQRFALFDELRTARDSGRAVALRGTSPIDGVDRFGTTQPVPDYPLSVVVSRDATQALAPWRTQALGTAARTLALALLAALLLQLLSRQVARVTAARESLETSEERFALAVAGSDDGIWDWDQRSGQIFASARAREIMGVGPGPELQPKEDWFASLQFHPEDAPRRIAAMEAHMAGLTPTYEGEYRVCHPDGSYRWVRIRGLCVRDAAGLPLRMAGSMSDIDARKRAEEALRQSQQRFELAVAGSNEGIWDWDLASDTVFFSARAQELMGLEPSEPVRPHREWVALMTYHPDDVDDVRRAMSDHLRGVSDHFEVEYRARHGSGDWRWYHERALAQRDAQGRAYRMAGSMEDISVRKNAEAERDCLDVQLRQSQKLEAMGTLAGGIAHDFNNILAAILGYGEMAQKDASEGTPLRRHIDAAMSAGLRAKSLVERILAFSRSGMGERALVHVQSVAAEALDVVAASLPRGVRLERTLDCGDAAVLGDPTQIHQVVMNLCANAVQAMTASQGTLAVAVDVLQLDAARRLTTRELPAGRYVRLAVRDSGSGIAPQLLDRIFDPFFTTKVVGVGTGLGLSLVHGIVTDLGGGIDVESRLGAGSSFTVWLPSPSITVPAPAADDGPLPAGGGETILLVDDEQPLVHLGEEMLAELGYEPVGFTSGTAALEAFRTAPERFDALLSDEAMPGLTGSELIKEIRRIRPDMPVVMMSGYVSAALAQRARDLGVSEVLAKPLVAREIARGLANALKAAATVD